MRALTLALGLPFLFGCTVIPDPPTGGGRDGGTSCSCSGRACGDDGCGNSCGTCGEGSVCNLETGQCLTNCVPDCGGRMCGLDPICGTSCGTCDDGNDCTVDECGDGFCYHSDPVVQRCVDVLRIRTCRGDVLHCGQLSRELHGENATYGCQGDVCTRTNFPDRPTCRMGDFACARAGDVHTIGQCVTDDTGATYWYFSTCEDVCSEPPFTGYTGRCEYSAERSHDVCLCMSGD